LLSERERERERETEYNVNDRKYTEKLHRKIPFAIQTIFCLDS